MATDITTTTGSSLQTRSPEPQLPDRLNDLLTSGESPVVGPNTAQALRDWLAGQPELPMPTEEKVDSMIARLSLATAKRKLSEAEAKEVLPLYWRALRDIPLPDLAAGFDDLLRKSRFMPTPAEVRTACSIYTAKRGHRQSRARWLVFIHERDWREPVETIPPAEVQALLAGTIESLTKKEEPDV